MLYTLFLCMFFERNASGINSGVSLLSAATRYPLLSGVISFFWVLRCFGFLYATSCAFFCLCFLLGRHIGRPYGVFYWAFRWIGMPLRVSAQFHFGAAYFFKLFFLCIRPILPMTNIVSWCGVFGLGNVVCPTFFADFYI